MGGYRANVRALMHTVLATARLDPRDADVEAACAEGDEAVSIVTKLRSVAAVNSSPASSATWSRTARTPSSGTSPTAPMKRSQPRVPADERDRRDDRADAAGQAPSLRPRGGTCPARDPAMGGQLRTRPRPARCRATGRAQLLALGPRHRRARTLRRASHRRRTPPTSAPPRIPGPHQLPRSRALQHPRLLGRTLHRGHQPRARGRVLAHRHPRPACLRRARDTPKLIGHRTRGGRLAIP